MNKLELMKIANEVRKGAVTAVYNAKSGHPGGSLSAADIYAYLFFEEMNIDPKEPKKADRDRFVLSKGHTAPGYYAALAHRGFFPVEDLTTLRKVGSYLQGHPDMKHIPGVDMSSGSLGQGISAAVGMALSAKLSNEDYRVYTLLGDGEIQEGQVWEAAMLASHRKLDNLVVIVDNNGLQIDGAIDEVCSPYPIDKKFEAFNFHVINVDGHDFDALDAAFKEAQKNGEITAEVIKNAVFQKATEIENKFNELPITFGQAMTMAGNSLLIGMDEIFTGISTSGVGMIQTLVENFDILAGILGYIAGVSLVILVRNIAAALPGAAALALSFIAMNWQVLLVVAAVGMLMKLFLAFPEAFGVIMGGINAMKTAFMNLVKMVADYFILLFNNIILRGMNFVLDKLGKEKIGYVSMFAMEDVGASYKSGYDWGTNFAKDTNTKIDSFLNTMKNTFNPNGVGATGGVKAKPITDLDTVGEVKNVKGGKISLDEDSIKWIKESQAIEFVNRYTTMRPIMRVVFGDVHQNADVGQIADDLADMFENAYNLSVGEE